MASLSYFEGSDMNNSSNFTSFNTLIDSCSSITYDVGGSMAAMPPDYSLTSEEEPPLLYELGIDFTQIAKRTREVLMPYAQAAPMSEEETELAGPLLFALALGFALLLRGKLHFGYIYGCGLLGSLAMYTVINLMASEQLSLDRTISILGYALLPIVLLAIGTVGITMTNTPGLILSVASIGWCTASATRMFEKALNMRQQRWLIAYPTTLLYACFALLTVF